MKKNLIRYLLINLEMIEIEKIKLNSIKDNKKFEINSIKILYSLTNEFIYT